MGSGSSFKKYLNVELELALVAIQKWLNLLHDDLSPVQTLSNLAKQSINQRQNREILLQLSFQNFLKYHFHINCKICCTLFILPLSPSYKNLLCIFHDKAFCWCVVCRILSRHLHSLPCFVCTQYLLSYLQYNSFLQIFINKF